MKIKSIIAAISVSLLLAGCASIMGHGEAPAQGADVMFKEDTRKSFERVDLVELFINRQLGGLDVSRNAEGKYCLPINDLPATKGTTGKAGCFDGLEDAYGYFANALNEKGEPEQKTIRTRIQDRIIAASNQRCGDFLRALHQYEGNMSFGLGALATTLGAAGAIFTPANTARAFSGSGAAISGIRAEFSSSYYRNKAIEVLTKGIRARRRAIREGMCSRVGEGIDTYTTWAAIADAVQYHSACSAITGLEEASDSVTKIQDPGVGQMNSYLDQLLLTREKAAKLSNHPQDALAVTKAKAEAKIATADAAKVVAEAAAKAADAAKVAAEKSASPEAKKAAKAAAEAAAKAGATLRIQTSSRTGPLACVKEETS